MKKHNILFGPVPSRRLGISLGVDLIPYKTCTMDCIYCECGKTTELTNCRQEYYPIEKVLSELDTFLSKAPQLDYITFAGSGEPTLFNKLGEVVDYLKSNYPQYSLAIITNSTLINNPEIFEIMKKFDLVVPSLDAISTEAFAKITRPADNVNPLEIVDGLARFRKEYTGKIWLEIFIVPTINDTKEELDLLIEASKKINPDKIHINSLDRPGTEGWVTNLTKERKTEIENLFAELSVEAVSNYRGKKVASFDVEKTVLETLRRRPCTLEDLSRMTGASTDQVQKIINSLDNVTVRNEERGQFFFIEEAVNTK